MDAHQQSIWNGFHQLRPITQVGSLFLVECLGPWIMKGYILCAQQHGIHPVKPQNGVQTQGDGQVDAALHRASGGDRPPVLPAVPGVYDHSRPFEAGRAGQDGDRQRVTPAVPDGRNGEQQYSRQDQSPSPLPGPALPGPHTHTPFPAVYALTGGDMLRRTALWRGSVCPGSSEW